MCSSRSVPAPPGKSIRSTPVSPPSPVERTLAGLPPCSSTQRRISSWSVVVLVLEAIDRSSSVGRRDAPRRASGRLARRDRACLCSRRRRLAGAAGVGALLGGLGLRQLPVDVVPVEVAEERLHVLLAAVRRGAEVAHVRVLVDVDRQNRNHVVDGPQVLRVHDVVEQRAVVEVIADHHPAARGGGGLLDRGQPLVDAVELAVGELGEAAGRLAPVTAEVAEVEVVVLVAEQRERVVDRHGAQRRVDLVALDLVVIELIEDSAALVRLLGVALVQLVVVVHRLAGDPVEIALEGGEPARLELIPRHVAPFADVISRGGASPLRAAGIRDRAPEVHPMTSRSAACPGRLAVAVLLQRLRELLLRHLRAAGDAGALRVLVELLLRLARVDAAVGPAGPGARLRRALGRLRIRRALPVLELPVVAALLGDVLDRRIGRAVRPLLAAVLLVRAVERLRVRPLHLLRRARDRAGQVFLRGRHDDHLHPFVYPAATRCHRRYAPVLVAKSEHTTLEVAGREVRLSNPGKVYFPKPGWTKLELAEYYVTVADA